MQNIVTLVLDMLRIYLLPSIYKLILLKIKYIKDVITFLKFDTVTVLTFILFRGATRDPFHGNKDLPWLFGIKYLV
jgi:hypothetical protein